MKNIQGLWKIALLLCFMVGITILFIDLAIERGDYSLVNRDPLKEFSTPWQLSDGEEEEGQSKKNQIITLPYTLEVIRVGQPITLSNVLPEVLMEDSYVFLRARHQFVQAYIDGKLVYSYGTKDQRLFGESPASAWILIPVEVSAAGSRIEIQVTPAYQTYSDRLNLIYYGNRSAILYELVIKRIPSIFMCIALFMLGIGMILASMSLRNVSITRPLYRLGLLSLVTTVWSLCIMNILQVIIGDPFALLNLEFITFHLLLPVFLWFLLSFEYYKAKKPIHVLYVLSIVLFLVINILQVTNLADYMNTIVYSHILIVVSLIYLSSIGLKALFLKKAPEEVKIFMVSMLVLVVFLGIDLILFYIHTSQDEGFYSRIGLLIFIGIWMYDIIRAISKMMVRIAKTEIFEQLAFQDQLTGIENRRAFEKKLNEYRMKSKKEDLYFIAFDLNNLKYVNDHFGHNSGDFAIQSVASILQKAFGTMGTCYRIGGDEFFALVPVAACRSNEDLKKKLEGITREVQEISRTRNMEYSIACGMAKLSENENRIDTSIRAADAMMYENKAKMKGESYVKI